jgi:hypothetical protein
VGTKTILTTGLENASMPSNEKFKQGQIVTDGDELLIVDRVPTLTDDSYEVSSFENTDDLVDDSPAPEEHITGTRAMGAAIGTMHAERLLPRKD